MAQYVSPGVYITERDLSVIPGSVSTTEAGIAGVFRWGPVNTPITVESEPALVATFGSPTNLNAETFFTASSYLAYARPLKVARAANTVGSANNIANTVTNALATTAVPSNTVIVGSIVANADDAEGKAWNNAVKYVAKWPGALGNTLKVSVCESPSAYESSIALVPNNTIEAAQTAITFNVGSNTAVVQIVPSGSGTGTDTLAVANTIAQRLVVGDNIKAGNSTVGTQLLKVTNISSPVQQGANTVLTVSFENNYILSAATTSNTINRTWEFFNVVNRAPGTSLYQRKNGQNSSLVDEIHLVVIDKDGLFTGIPGQILETFEAVSRNTQARSENGASTFFKNVINSSSRYIWAASDLNNSPSGDNATITASAATVPVTLTFAYGQDGLSESLAPLSDITRAYDEFVNTDEIQIGVLLQGAARDGVNGTGLANYLINNIAEVRKDCIVCVSPRRTDVVQSDTSLNAERVVAFRNSLSSTSYAVLDSGYKYTYDRYNDVYRYVPLNGDIGGIMSRSDVENDPWVSPAGSSRGRLKGVVKLAWNPTQAQRDTLYRNDVNPVVTQAGQGTILYGDKTILGRNSAFNKINVRKLFIVVQKAIAQAAQSLLWEFNNSQTQSQFVNMIEPYLRDVQSRGGINTFAIVADQTVNTPQIIDSGGFVGNILISPARSIDTVQLNFYATRTGVQFEEIIGRL